MDKKYDYDPITSSTGNGRFCSIDKTDNNASTPFCHTKIYLQPTMPGSIFITRIIHKFRNVVSYKCGRNFG